MRARQAVRSLAQEFDPPPGDLPVWAAADIPESHVDLVNAYGRAEGWSSQQTALDEQREILTSPGFRTTLHALSGLYPTNPVPGQLLALFDEINEAGIDAIFAHRLADHDRHALSPPGSTLRPGPSQSSFSASTELRSPTRSRSTSSPAPTMTLPASTSRSST